MPAGNLSDELQKLRSAALTRIREARTEQELESVRVEVLGRKGGLTGILRALGGLPEGERARVGGDANRAKQELTEAIDGARQNLAAAPAPALHGIDVTLPGRVPEIGSRHPIYLVTNRMLGIFQNLGFTAVDGPEAEDEFHNFIGLNIPAGHIARDPDENFYLGDNLLLRSQTSTVQVRAMEGMQPPLRIVAPGKVYRPDTVDATHSYMFHQLEGLAVAEGLTLRHLKSTLLLFFRQFFQKDVRVRLRPSFFPFTEPSAEIDLSCPFCGGGGCKVCKQQGWIEMGGCGMVDPNVFKAVGYDDERYTGFAFGMGIDRLAMGYYDIPDIRYLFENDVRFLEQFTA